MSGIDLLLTRLIILGNNAERSKSTPDNLIS